MFIETHAEKVVEGSTLIPLTFIKSTNVQVYPCGRRRSSDIENYRIPFDPEARLNTEVNSRKHSSLNGFTQTYFKSSSWDNYDSSDVNDGSLVISLDGYLFTIKLEKINKGTIEAPNFEDYRNITEFGAKVASNTNATDENNYIYANILMETVPLYTNDELDLDYETTILRNQSQSSNDSNTAEDALDLPISPVANSNNLSELQKIDNYYFSGLSFSVRPLTGNTYSTYSEVCHTSSNIKKKIVSLCLLEKLTEEEEINGIYVPKWKVYEPARLPKIEHGYTEDSIIIGDTHVDSLDTPTATVTDKLTVTKDIELDLDDDNTFAAGISSAKIDTAKITTAHVDTLNNTNANIDDLKAQYAYVGGLVADPEYSKDGQGDGYIYAKKFYQDIDPVPIIRLNKVTQEIKPSVGEETCWQLDISSIRLIKE